MGRASDYGLHGGLNTEPLCSEAHVLTVRLYKPVLLSSRSRSWPRGHSRTHFEVLGLGLESKGLGLGLGLDSEGLGLGLGLDKKVLALVLALTNNCWPRDFILHAQYD
jgi:hypothetical protein